MDKDNQKHILLGFYLCIFLRARKFPLRGHVKCHAIKLIHGVPAMVLVIHRNDKLMAASIVVVMVEVTRKHQVKLAVSSHGQTIDHSSNHSLYF